MEALNAVLKSEKRVLLYIGTNDCSVCQSTKPRIEAILTAYPRFRGVEVSVYEHPDIAGQFLAFSLPVVLIFEEGREVFRSGRFLDFHQIEAMLQRRDENSNEDHPVSGS